MGRSESVARSARESAEVRSEHHDSSGRRRNHAADEVEEGRLSRPRWSEQEDTFAGRQRKSVDREREAMLPRPRESHAVHLQRRGAGRRRRSADREGGRQEAAPMVSGGSPRLTT